MKYDHVLFIGFGAPESQKDIPDFLKIVTRGRNIPEARIQEVSHHYDQIGGGSPYNRITERFIQKVEAQLAQSKMEVPLYMGMRNWHPFLQDTLEEIRGKGLQSGLGIILAPHRSETSCFRYKQNVLDAKAALNDTSLHYDFMESFFDDPLFIEAQAELLKSELEQNDTTNPYVIFTAHSIPLSMIEKCARCDYKEEFKISSKLIAERLGLKNWTCAYQSRSGNPRDPWLEPDILTLLEELADKKVNHVCLVPVGFLCDNAEVLFDLDIEAKEKAISLGLSYRRAQTVMEHEAFVNLIARRIQHDLKQVTV